ncbi:MAG: DUF2116 family Zn-ribbon domain-containing protein [Flammeovirgaceae bacterium]|nr:DUF2116 family Zn-ribbon domain-containing protein [Flammeovirgaceae bacterium]
MSSGIRKCAECGQPISGRSDKKFCSDQCRFLFNSDVRQKTEQPILDVNKALRKNRSILKSLCPQGKATVRKEVLTSMGYNFELFTTIFITKSKSVYYLCYDYGFTPLREGKIQKALVISRQSYMKHRDPWLYVKDDIEKKDYSI